MMSQREEYKKSLDETLRLLCEGKPPHEIAHKRRLAISTIESHLQRLLEDGRVELEELLDNEGIASIKDAISKVDASKEHGLKQIKLRLPEDVSYGEIKYVLTSIGRFKRKTKSAVRCAINTYMGNYCFRKCFRHHDLILECKEKFDKLEKAMGDVNISFGELKSMINSGDITICKLPPEKRRVYVPWMEFERLADAETDFWEF